MGRIWKRLSPRLQRLWRLRDDNNQAECTGKNLETWEYKVVQLISQTPPDAAGASKKLGGALSPESLRNQFPEHYGNADGRKQINDFLNRLGEEGWELVQVQIILELPLMLLKRRAGSQKNQNSQTAEAAKDTDQENYQSSS